MSDSSAKPVRILELFHAITDPASAEARRAVVELGLEPMIRFRNVTYPEVRADLTARGGGASLPALYDGTTLHQGLSAVLPALRRMIPAPGAR